jgi:hypothetical protein
MSKYLVLAALTTLSLLACAQGETDGNVAAGAQPENYDLGELVRKAEYGQAWSKVSVFTLVYENLPEASEYVDAAVRLLREAAAEENHLAQFNLGYLLVHGELVEKDIDEGLLWLEKAADGGIRRANLWLGLTYYERYIVQANGPEGLANASFAKAENWLQSAIVQSDEPDDISLFAEEALGRAYVRRSILDEKGWEHLFNAASHGHRGAIDTLEEYRSDFQAALDDGNELTKPLVTRIDAFLATLSETPQEPD